MGRAAHRAGLLDPNSTLIFEVELMSIKDKNPPPDKAPAPAAAPDKNPAGAATASPTPAASPYAEEVTRYSLIGAVSKRDGPFTF